MKNLYLCFNTPRILVYLLACMVFPSIAEGLQYGQWAGSYTLYQSETVDVGYEVSNVTTENEKSVTIKYDHRPGLQL
ncbi:MAG: hypothetical protein ACI9KN_000168 [Gammaproteobacteria bacterium]|jgi:hypothetical protein